MTRHAAFLLIGLLLATAGARASPIGYTFAGEMTEFIPPITQPGVPLPPVPDYMRFFTGSFAYDPAGGGDHAVTDIVVSFADGTMIDGPTLGESAVTRTLTRSTLSTMGGTPGIFSVSIGTRGLRDADDLDYSLFALLQRPADPGDVDEVLPATLDGFSGPLFSIDLGGQFLFTGALTDFQRADIVQIAAPSALSVSLSVAFAAFTLTGWRCRRRAARPAPPAPAAAVR